MKALTVLLACLAGEAVLARSASHHRALAPRQTDDNTELMIRVPTPLNYYLALILQLFPFDIALRDATGLITVAEQALANAFDIQTVANELPATGQACPDITIVYARGTTELGNVGVLVGPAFIDAVLRQAGPNTSVAVQGVDYAADVAGFLAGGDAAGSQQMADDISQALQVCPSTKVLMGGCSQGGQVTHNAARLLPAATAARVSAVVIFGDPDYGQPVVGVPAEKTLVICHFGDDICAGGSLILLPHLTYAIDSDLAASFVIAQTGTGGVTS